jgi:hypothetical protein
MDRDSSQHFSDSELKGAITRNFGNETAPAELHARVRRALQDAAEPPLAAISPRPLRARHTWLKPLAAAAILLVGLAALGYQLWDMFRPLPQFAPVALQLELALAEQIVARHDACAASGAHHHLASISDSDFAAMSNQLSSVLKHPVLVHPLEGWTFRGASICRVGHQRAAHLLFTRGDAVLSLLSLPAPEGEVSFDGVQCSMMHDLHPIAGYVRADAMFCLVGSSPTRAVGLKELKRLRDELQSIDFASCDVDGSLIVQER